jgi:Tol biopolymer transport system component
MGEVYKARDTRLGRTVAIKVAKDNFTERFEREARAVAALNHPNICSLYDAGPNYLVMEYLSGDRPRGPLPVDTAVRYAAQICDALSAAHDQGIVHRDLKPANIMITKSGVKVLDFGLAKMTGTAAPMADLTTQQGSLTQSGLIVGTPAYMSPEQIEGESVDARTDIFALGCVVYEMLSGRSPFQGKSAPSLIASILKEEPARLRDKASEVPPSLERAIVRCLAKDPNARWQNAQDARHAMEDARTEATTTTPPSSRWGRVIAAFVAGVVLASTVAAYVLRRPDQEQPVMRLKVAAPANVEFLRAPNRGGMALSPDGRLLAFTGLRDGQMRLWIQPIDSTSARELAGTDRAHLPFWSPDNRSLGFFADGKLKRIDIDGGGLQVLADAPVPQGGSWGRGGLILFAPDYASIYKISSTGGMPALVKKADAKSPKTENLLTPRFLADGRRFLYWRGTPNGDVAGVYVASIDDPKLDTSLGRFDSWVTPAKSSSQGGDYLMWVRGETVMAQSWDSSSLKLLGEAVPLGGPVGVLGNTPELTVSENGMLVYGTAVELQMTWIDRNGKPLGVVGEAGFLSSPRLSPDGSRVIYSRSTPDAGLIISDVMRGISSRLVPVGRAMNWSPDGSQFAFDRTKQSVVNIAVRRADGTGEERLVAPSADKQHLIAWTDGGKSLLYYEWNLESARELRTVGVAPGSKPRVLRSSAHSEPEADLSPDGRWFAYASDAGNRLEVYVEPFNTQSSAQQQRWQVSTKGGTFPRWGRNGQELFYVSNDGELMAVSVRTTGESLDLTPPRPLFSLPAVFNGSYAYDVGLDGQRFLVSTVSPRRGREPLSVIVNWPALVSRK